MGSGLSSSIESKEQLAPLVSWCLRFLATGNLFSKPRAVWRKWLSLTYALPTDASPVPKRNPSQERSERVSFLFGLNVLH